MVLKGQKIVQAVPHYRPMNTKIQKVLQYDKNIKKIKKFSVQHAGVANYPEDITVLHNAILKPVERESEYFLVQFYYLENSKVLDHNNTCSETSPASKIRKKVMR